MEAKYNHRVVEQGKHQKWLRKRYFATHDVRKPPFSIILPPPNVTGKLHLGHAWDGFLQDTIIRYKKLAGFDVCFVPGMDHAGIATQAKVEAHLATQGLTKHDLGRTQFLDHALAWKTEYAELIRQQWATLGLALDYDFERFTLDKGSNAAVNHVFIEMYRRGLIYRGVRPINWDPHLKTAISNIEVIAKPTRSQMYYIRYQLATGGGFIVIATTRPETIFSDVAVAISPTDQAKQHLVGHQVVNPLTQELLPILTDDCIDPNFGTGFMKVSAHASTDIEIILKHQLAIRECIDQDGRMNVRGGFTQGMDRFEARAAVCEFLQTHNQLERVEIIENNVSHSERSDAVVEILVMPQWFVKMDALAQQLLANLDSAAKVKIYPARFEETLRQWMTNVKDWTISRQLWWGHQIPAWYKGDQIKVQLRSPGPGWVRDPDVLDTWFSSALCPFSFWGWPQPNPALSRYFPTSVLVTGYDIIFFWVARMYFQSLEFTHQIPFRDLLIHGLIRDEQGRKMSKSLGNGIDPMVVIENHGADALRWFLLTNSAPGQDINYSQAKIEAAWNLNNKLWNIARFLKTLPEQAQPANPSVADIWIASKLATLESLIAAKLEQYEFTIIGKAIHHFVYDDFSSWYVEFMKVWPNKAAALVIFKNLLLLLHPFLPFLSDHLFGELFGTELLEAHLDLPQWGQESEVQTLIDVISLLREARSSFNISHKVCLAYEIKSAHSRHAVAVINKLANATYQPNDDTLLTVNATVVAICLDPNLKAQALIKLRQEISKLEAEIHRSETILHNQDFQTKAPLAKVAAEAAKYDKYQTQHALLKAKLRELE